MKFAALVLLLAVGSQAASLQADAPNQFHQVRERAKESALRVLAPIDQTQYKDQVRAAVDTVDQKLAQAIEIGQGAVGAVDDATAEIRKTLMTDVQKFQADVADHSEKAREAILAHVQEYIAALTPVKTHLESKRADVEEFRDKVKAAVEAIGEKVPGNWEVTKGHLIPIYDKLVESARARGEDLKTQLMPYMTEYVESFQTADKAAAFEDAKAKISAYVSAFLESMGKN